MVFISFYINFRGIHLWEISMTNKLFMVIIIVLVVMVGYMAILGNNYSPNINHNSKNMNSTFYLDNGKNLIKIGSKAYDLFNSNNTLQNSVSPDVLSLSGNSTGNFWLIFIDTSYPFIWTPYFNSGNYGIPFTITSQNSIQYGNLSLNGGTQPLNTSVYVYGSGDFIILPEPIYNASSIVTIAFNLNEIIDTSNNNTISVNNLSMPFSSITLKLGNYPLGNYQEVTCQPIPGEGNTTCENVNVSAVFDFHLYYPFAGHYIVTFKGEQEFNVTLVNPNPNQASLTFFTKNGYLNITLSNGTYNYLIYNGYNNFSGSFVINGNNTTVFISPSAFFVHSPLFDFYVYLFIVFTFLITILHFTRGSMVFLSFSSLIFLYIGYKLDITLFTINAILLMVLIFSAMISYKVFLE